MANTVTAAKKNENVRQNTFDFLFYDKTNLFEDGTLTQIGENKFAYRTTDGENERFAEITIVSKNNKDTKTTAAFDVGVAKAEYLADKEYKINLAKARASKKKR